MTKFFPDSLICFSFFVLGDPEDKVVYVVNPNAETPQVVTKGDAADDPAIWINNISTTNSLIFGTDKKSGVYTYDLDAKKIGYTELGNINNIDLRSINLDEFGSYTFIFASNRTTSSLDLWIYEDEAMDALAKSKKFNIENNPSFKGSTNIIVYGVCAGYDQEFGVIAFITEDEGSRVQMWSYSENGLSLLKTFNNANAAQSEGCVYDDENETIFISREGDKGILKAFSVDGFKYLQDVDSRAGEIEGDPEGVSIYKTSNKEGYLVVSSQGNSTFNLYNRKTPYQYVGTFMILGAQGIDEVRDTDGIDVSSIPLPGYPRGMMVAQDGFNTNQKGKLFNQNFKYISFKDVLDQIEP